MRKIQRKQVQPGIGELLEHVPVLVKAYGRWPSFVYLLLFTPFSRGLLGALATIIAIIVYRGLL